MFYCWARPIGTIAYIYYFRPRNLSLDESDESQKNLKNYIKTTLDPICEYTDLVRRDDCVSDILYIRKLQYLVVSSVKGRLSVYKWELKRNDDTRIAPEVRSRQFMHTFEAHQKAITCLKPVVKNDSYVMSASLDGSIKIWDLDGMIEINTFEVHSANNDDEGSMDEIDRL